MNTPQALIAEARSYGLDVELERCDLLLLRADLLVLRALEGPRRTEAVVARNAGYSPRPGFRNECACGEKTTARRCETCGRPLVLAAPRRPRREAAWRA